MGRSNFKTGLPQMTGVPAPSRRSPRSATLDPRSSILDLRRAFTLIEMLLVIAVIGILAGLLLPAISKSITKGKCAVAKADIKSIEHAIRLYYNEYGKLPVKDSDQGVADKTYTFSSCAGSCSAGSYTPCNILNVLRAIAVGDNAGNALNPRQIVFLDTPSRKNAFDTCGNFFDPWGKAYLILLDNNYDSGITYTSGTYTYGSSGLLCIVVSFGPNKTQDRPDTNDDIVNYQ